MDILGPYWNLIFSRIDGIQCLHMSMRVYHWNNSCSVWKTNFIIHSRYFFRYFLSLKEEYFMRNWRMSTKKSTLYYKNIYSYLLSVGKGVRGGWVIRTGIVSSSSEQEGMEGGIVDWVFWTFWASFGAVAVLVDPCGLALGFWPPRQICDVMSQYAQTMDPIYGMKPLWLKVCVATELTLYPFFCIAACYALRRGISRSEWIRTPSVIITTIILQSYAQIIAHNFFSAENGLFVAVPPRPLLWLALYLPYMIIPPCWCARIFLWQPRHSKQD